MKNNLLVLYERATNFYTRSNGLNEIFCESRLIIFIIRTNVYQKACVAECVADVYKKLKYKYYL